jgi:hypothetical protein
MMGDPTKQEEPAPTDPPVRPVPYPDKPAEPKPDEGDEKTEGE